MGASQPIENQQRSYEVLEKKHYMECTTPAIAFRVFGARRHLDVRFISSLPAMQRPACMVWADKRPVQIVWAVR